MLAAAAADQKQEREIPKKKFAAEKLKAPRNIWNWESEREKRWQKKADCAKEKTFPFPQLKCSNYI